MVESSAEENSGGGEEKGLYWNWIYKKITPSSHSDLSRSIIQSTDSAIRSARHLQHSSSNLFQSIQDFVPEIRSQCKTYEDALVNNVKDELSSATDHPVMACGIAVAAGFILLRGPRRFLFRNTIGRLQSEEAQFVKAEKNVKALTLSVDLMKKESTKLLERANFAETEMNSGHTALRVSGTQIRQLAKAVYKAEAEAVAQEEEEEDEEMDIIVAACAKLDQNRNSSNIVRGGSVFNHRVIDRNRALDMMDFLREIPGRQALKLRAEVASMASTLRQQRTAVDKRIMKISELGVSV